MSFTIEFDDNRLTEKINDLYKEISISCELGLSFVDFISLGENVEKSEHIYFDLVEDMTGRITNDSRLYSRLLEFVELCIKAPSLYTIDNFMFFLHIVGLSLPEHHLEYNFDVNNPVENNVSFNINMSPFEISMRGFARSDKSKNAITSVYTCDSIEDICIASLYHLLKLGFMIKKCNNCNKYFVPLRRSDAIYCDRNSPFNSTKTCKEDGSQRTFEEKLEKDVSEKLRRSIYLVKQMRVRRNPDNASYRDDFEKWKINVSKWKKDVKKGKRTSEEFINWLNDSKKK